MKYYMVGIKGAGLSALALILNDLGYEVVGYDDELSHQFTEDKLIERGIKIYTEANEALDKECIIVRSSAIKEEHPEIIKANELGLKIYEYHEMLGKLANIFELITVAGCHGKTTTSCMMAHVLNDIIGCNYLIGDGEGKASRDNKKFVIEACEYRRNFLVYEPDYAIITNIDLDHVDYFKDISDVIDAYQEYANNAEKMVIACGDDPYTHSLEVNKPIFYYGLEDDNDIIAKDVEYHTNGISFDVLVEENYYGHFDLPIYGKHMLLDTLAVIAVCYYERLDAKEVAKSLKTFEGAKRRFTETKIGNIVIVDDYAHHPSEVRATIKSAKQKYPDKKIVAVFEPHTFSRTQEFADELAKVFNTIDKSYIMDVFPAREKEEDYPGVNANSIIDLLDNGEYIDSSMVDKLKELENTVVLFMSPKEIYNLKQEYINYLEENNN